MIIWKTNSNNPIKQTHLIVGYESKSGKNQQL